MVRLRDAEGHRGGGREVNVAALAIIQARLGSSRLPGKMLLPLCGKPLVQRVWETTCEAFGVANVVIAIPARSENLPLWTACRNFGADVFVWEGDENDVLGRFHACAHSRRWHPESVIVRVTPDDPFKNATMMKRVANGERLPVESSCEAFTLAQLDEAHRTMVGALEVNREHITWALFPTHPPKAPDKGFPWSIDTREDYEAVRRIVERH